MITQIVTWSECITDPQGEVEALAPVTGITGALILGYASEAQFQLQEKSRAVHRVIVFSGSKVDKTRKTIQIDDDVWRITTVRRSLNNKECGFIKPVSLTELRRLEIAGHYSDNSTYGPHRVAVDRRELHFNFLPNAAEKIHVEYDPYLLPFSAQRAKVAGDWQGATADNIGFDNFITTHGPEAEFWPHLSGIKGYVAMCLLQKLGNLYIKTYWGSYLRFKSAWETALGNIAGDQPNNTINDRPAAYIGPVG